MCGKCGEGDQTNMLKVTGSDGKPVPWIELNASQAAAKAAAGAEAAGA